SAIVANTNVYVIRELYVIDAVLKLHDLKCDAKEWVILNWLLLFLIYGISKVFRAVWDSCLICLQERWRRYCISPLMLLSIQDRPHCPKNRSSASGSTGIVLKNSVLTSEPEWEQNL